MTSKDQLLTYGQVRLIAILRFSLTGQVKINEKKIKLT